MSNKMIVSEHQTANSSFMGYTIGFVLSLVLTLAAYLLTVTETAHGWTLILMLAALAVMQLFVQLIFFLHLRKESKPFWNMSVLVFAAGVVVIVVFGSLWIMYNLDYNHGHGNKSPKEAERSIIKDEGY